MQTDDIANPQMNMLHMGPLFPPKDPARGSGAASGKIEHSGVESCTLSHASGPHPIITCRNDDS